jgi:hypothetical protein
VDAYIESIWGPRLRRSDVEFAVIQSIGDESLSDFKHVSHMTLNEIINDIIRNILICEAKTERIIGGDRVEDQATLL